MTIRTAVIAVAALALSAALAGCARDGGDETIGTDADLTPIDTDPSLAQFEVQDLQILAPDGTPRTLYEDDTHATVRWVVHQPASAPGVQTGFVSYSFEGRVLASEPLRLGPGEFKEFERRVDLTDRDAFSVEVRAGAARVDASAEVLTWPRAGETLTLGPMRVGIDHGLKDAEGRVIVNISLDHTGPAEPVSELRVRMLCVDEKGEIVQTTTVRPPMPTHGNSTRVDVTVDDCVHQRYGLEVKLDRAGGADPYWGRILLVPHGWQPPAAQP